MKAINPLELIIGIINLLATLACVGVFVYTIFVYKRPYPDEFAEFEKMQEAAKDLEKQTNYKFEKMTLNLHSENRPRYLAVEMYFIPFHSKDTKLWEESKEAIYDAIISITSDFTPEEINTITGKILYEGRIRTAVNRLSGKATLKQVSFTQFVVQ